MSNHEDAHDDAHAHAEAEAAAIIANSMLDDAMTLIETYGWDAGDVLVYLTRSSGWPA